MVVVESPSLEVLKEGLDMALSAMVWLTWWCSITGWTPWPQRFFQPNQFRDSVINELTLTIR